MPQEALDVMTAWGFEPKTEIIWLKKTCTGRRWFGMGRTVRAEHESCLVGTRGKPVTRSRSVRSTFEAVAGRRSEKPERFYDIVEALREGPYVELFRAGTARAGRVSGTSCRIGDIHVDAGIDTSGVRSVRDADSAF